MTDINSIICYVDPETKRVRVRNVKRDPKTLASRLADSGVSDIRIVENKRVPVVAYLDAETGRLRVRRIRRSVDAFVTRIQRERAAATNIAINLRPAA